MLLDKLLLSLATAGEFDSAAVAGMGGAGVANGQDTTSIQRSPAAMLLDVGYTGQSEFHFSLADGPLVGGTVSVMDTRTSNFGAGVTTSRQWSNVPPPDDELPGWKEKGAEFSDKRWEQTWRLAMGYGVLRRQVLNNQGSYNDMRRLAFGGSVVYGRTVSELSGNLNTWEFDASVAGRPHAIVSVAATVHGIGDMGSEETWGEAGVYLTPGRWAFAADGLYRPLSTEDPYGFRGGAQVQVDTALIRAGVALDEGAWRGTAGLGIASEGVRMDYALGWTVANNTFDHGIGFYGEF